jgi:serine protease inhibitor
MPIMHTQANAILAVIGVVTLSGCGLFTQPEDGPPAQLTALPRALTADEQRISLAANQFAFNLFRRLNAAQPNENVFVSPLSVSFSLGMAMNGASGSTLDQMRSTLGFGAAELEQINQGYQGLIALEAGLDESTTFDIANSVWYKQDFTVNQSFIDQVKAAFEADVTASPFDATTKTAVNDWVNAKTNGKIPTIIESINPLDVMFLVNAIYFKGSWREQFDPAKTRPMLFRGKSGEQSATTMVRDEGEGKLRFASSAAATVGELVYGNGAFVMTIVMPNDAYSIEALTAGLDTASWSALIGQMQERDFMVRLPKFTLSYERELKDDLIALGMEVPFSDIGADFSRMTPQQVYIAFVKHKTYVDVNEEGTEAAAVTNTGMRMVSMPPCLCVDRPFVFAIRERFSGTILFIGKIVNIP